MRVKRTIKHLLTPGWWVRRAFRGAALKAIETAVGDAERSHRGELRFVVEGARPLPVLLRGETARQRAVDLFSQLRVWDTEHNSGLLIYVQFVDRRVEIVADRGIAARVPQTQWDEICRGMESCFRVGAYRRGALEAIEKAGRLLTTHFPRRGNDANELPDRPVILS